MKFEYANQRIKINTGWEFAKESPQDFVPVEIPHDWLIADTHNLYQSGVGYYRRTLDTDFLKPEQRLYLYFDGVYMDTTVLINGKNAYEWKYGCTAFWFDITDYLVKDAPNEILVKVNYQAPNARWYTGAGIYRDVFLIVKNACHIQPDGIYVSTYQEDEKWLYRAQADVVAQGTEYTLRHEIVEQNETIRPWDIDDPKLYTLRSDLVVDGKVTDTVFTRFGFRSLRFTTDEGFYLNGKPVKIKGVCRHSDLGGLGSAVNKDAMRRQLMLMKRMGVNAIRTSHNPPAKELMELTDEMGFLVMSEILDIWRQPKTDYDYARFFNEWIQRDVASWVRRDRNHPSVIMWSIGNEIHDTHLDAEKGMETVRYLTGLVRRHDPHQNAPVTLCSNYMAWENTQRSADVIKLMGYNYGEDLYASHHEEHPDWMIYGSETASSVQSRGIYHFPLSQSLLSDDDMQCSALGNSHTSWGTKDLEAMILNDLHSPYSLGQFIWTGQDYIGEPTPYQTKNSYFGHVDTAGFPKDSFYLFQAGWIPFDTQPVLHLFPYWDFTPGERVDVRVCSNAPVVELFLNGESLGKRSLNGKLLADWQLSYQPGVLKAVAYNQDGKIVRETQRKSFGDAASVTITSEIYGDLHFFTISALDADGNPVDNANRRVRVKVKGGRLLALDNGDSTDYEQYQNTDNRRLFSGKLLAIVKAEADETPHVSASLCDEDIPIRKVELMRDGNEITAVIYPHNATSKDFIWRVTDSAGIDSPIASIAVHPDATHATLTEKGDGTAYIRCMPKNGKEHAAFVSLLRVDISGLGKVNLDPYTFVTGGLYNCSNHSLDNGNERGVATLRYEESHIGFANLDFGTYGADTFELPLFPLESEPFSFEVWEGMPLEGGHKLAEFDYTLGSVWAVYQTATYTLPKRLKGITTLCFVFRKKLHMKGFVFKQLNKAFQTLHAADGDNIYGDHYLINHGAVEGIGNNVTIEFQHMDFGSEGTQTLSVCWRSSLPKNSMQLLFSGESGSIRRMITLESAAEYREATFSLGGDITGLQTVSLIFLPGCSLDLKQLRFIPKQ